MAVVTVAAVAAAAAAPRQVVAAAAVPRSLLWFAISLVVLLVRHTFPCRVFMTLAVAVTPHITTTATVPLLRGALAHLRDADAMLITRELHLPCP